MGRRGAETRRRLQAAALELYAEQGFAATTVASVAAKAGLTERTFFRYFPDKREVLFADDQELDEALLATVRDAPDHTDAWDVARRALGTMADNLESRRDHLRLRARITAANPDLAERDVVKQDRVVDALRRAMHQHGADAGEAALAAAVGGAVFRVAYTDWVSSTGDDSLATRLNQSIGELRRLQPLT